MKDIFSFDVTLKELMNLGSRAKDVKALDVVFKALHIFWYKLDDKKAQKEREDGIRVGSVKVYLDDDYHLHIDFLTRFNLENTKPFLSILERLKDEDAAQMLSELLAEKHHE